MTEHLVAYVQANRRLLHDGIDPSLYDACTDLVERIVNERRGMWRVSAGVTCAYFSSAQKRSVAVALKGEPFVLFDESPIRLLDRLTHVARKRDPTQLKQMLFQLLKEELFANGDIDRAIAFHLFLASAQTRAVELTHRTVASCLLVLAHEIFHVELHRNAALASEIQQNVPSLYPLFKQSFEQLIRADNADIVRGASGAQRLERCWDEVRDYFGTSWTEAACDAFAVQLLYRYWGDHKLNVYELIGPLSDLSAVNNLLARVRVLKEGLSGTKAPGYQLLDRAPVLTRFYLLCFWLEMLRPNSADLFRMFKSFGESVHGTLECMLSELLSESSMQTELRYIARIRFDSSDLTRQGEGFLARTERCAEYLGYSSRSGDVRIINGWVRPTS